METGTQEQRSNSKEWLKPWQFNPGQSGNPGGRPKGSKSLKAYAKEYLERLSDEEKLEYLKGIDKKTIWEMAEDKAKQGTDITSGGEKLAPLLVKFINEGTNS